MKADTERTIRYQSKMHKKKDFLHVHVSKELKKKLKVTKRSLLVHKGDKVKIMRGFARDKTGKVADVDYNNTKVYVEGISKRTARGKEVLVALQPSNLMLIELETTKERVSLFKEMTQGIVTSATHAKEGESGKIKVEHPTVVGAPHEEHTHKG